MTLATNDTRRHPGSYWSNRPSPSSLPVSRALPPSEQSAATPREGRRKRGGQRRRRGGSRGRASRLVGETIRGIEHLQRDLLERDIGRRAEHRGGLSRLETSSAVTPCWVHPSRAGG